MTGLKGAINTAFY